MAAGIPVNYRENGWLTHFFRLLGVLGLMGGIALAVFVRDGGLPGIILGCVAVFLLVINEVRYARQKAAERFVIDTGSGFRWLGGPTDVEVLDSQVVAVRTRRTSKFSAGILKGIVRRFEVWTADSDKPMCMTNRIGVNGTDPLAGLIARVIEDLKRRTAAGLADGAILEGDGWRLATMQLLVARGRNVEAVPFVEIDKVAVFDGKICLWRQGQDEPAARISPDSKNASVLASLITEWIAHQREASGDQPVGTGGASGMGRLLFERRRNSGLWLGVLFAVIGGLVGAALLCDRDTILLGVILLAAAVVVLCLGVVFGRYQLRCYESGLIRRRGRNELRLPYSDIVEFTYSATRMFYKGAYTGTQLNLNFRAPRSAIRYSAKVQNMDADLDDLRDHVAKTIASRMLCELRAGQTVPWTGDILLLPQGLQFRRPRMLGLASGPVEILPYEQIRGLNLNEGICYLYSKAEVKPVLTKPVGSANFFPGFFAVLTLIN